jgi:TubC N-terminal docking domain
MTAVQLMTDLAHLGIRLDAYGDRLRYSPKSAMTPDLVAQLRDNKAELLAMLCRDDVGADAEVDVRTVDPSELGADRWPIDTIPSPAPQPQESRSGRQVARTLPRSSIEACDRCGSTKWRDVSIHARESIRRDCAKCGRFIDFPRWHGVDRTEPTKESYRKPYLQMR